MDEAEMYFASLLMTFAVLADSFESTLLAAFSFATGLDVLDPVFWQLLQVHVFMSQATPRWKQSQYFLRHLRRQRAKTTTRISCEETKRTKHFFHQNSPALLARAALTGFLWTKSESTGPTSENRLCCYCSRTFRSGLCFCILTAGAHA
jgi:hypothetical protein